MSWCGSPISDHGDIIFETQVPILIYGQLASKSQTLRAIDKPWQHSLYYRKLNNKNATRIQTLTSDLGRNKARWDACMDQCNLLRITAYTTVEIQSGRSSRNTFISCTKHKFPNLGHSYCLQISCDVYLASNLQAVDGCRSNFCLLLVYSMDPRVSRCQNLVVLFECWVWHFRWFFKCVFFQIRSSKNSHCISNIHPYNRSLNNFIFFLFLQGARRRPGCPYSHGADSYLYHRTKRRRKPNWPLCLFCV